MIYGGFHKIRLLLAQHHAYIQQALFAIFLIIYLFSSLVFLFNVSWSAFNNTILISDHYVP